MNPMNPLLKTTLWTLVLAAGLPVPLRAGPTGEKNNKKEKWIALFNGKNLDGWTVKIAGCKVGENYKNTFRVEDGLLTVSYDQYDTFGGHFGHLFYNKPFSHYRLRVEYRFIGQQCPGGPKWAFRNSGIMIHGQSPQSMEINQNFPASIEVQLLGGDGKNPRPTANLCTPGTNVVYQGKLYTPHIINSSSKTYHGDQWVTVEVEVHGNRLIRHLIDGQVVLEYTQPQLDPRDRYAKKLIEQRHGQLMLSSGTISLQSESHPCQFRRIEILPLDE